jgi:hypothetical protein
MGSGACAALHLSCGCPAKGRHFLGGSMQLICTLAEDPLATGVTKAKGVKAEAKTS